MKKVSENDLKSTSASTRLTSLDAFRGITMFLLITEAASVYESLGHASTEGSFLGTVITQFHHHPWNGLRFWDLIQPFFMFIVGVAMPFSYLSRTKKGSIPYANYQTYPQKVFIAILVWNRPALRL